MGKGISMNRPVSVVVLAKYKEVFKHFLETCEKFCKEYNKVLVVDGNEIDTKNLPISWTIIQGPEKFSMAGNGNLGLKAVPRYHDILYCGDDIRFLQPKTLEKLQELAYKDSTVGILSPRIIGRGSPTQVNPSSELVECRPLEMWFPCVYIKREVLDNVGFLDEDFNNFGSDDLDYCIRAKLSNYKLCVTSEVVVKHEASPEGGPTTFVKNVGVDGWQQQQAQALEKLRQKYNASHSAFNKFLNTGDTKYLQKQDKLISPYERTDMPTKEEAMEYLRTRSLYLATPAYGGWLSVNYVNSLQGVANVCHDGGITFQTAFMHNESLVTRARNKLVHEFMTKTDATDFVFVDADIGFNPWDVVGLMMRDEDVIGAPCVRKNLRLDRIVTAVKKNGREYKQEELETLTGEYVLNFLGTPAEMDLGKLAEVIDVGTGLMRIKRETFERFMKFFPDRWYLPMGGEDRQGGPMYMFFQAGFDEDSRKYNPNGYPDYIPEDFAFCRDCRKAGMRVWLAPWFRTSHMGSFMFQGDLQAVAAAGGCIR